MREISNHIHITSKDEFRIWAIDSELQKMIFYLIPRTLLVISGVFKGYSILTQGSNLSPVVHLSFYPLELKMNTAYPLILSS